MEKHLAMEALAGAAAGHPPASHCRTATALGIVATTAVATVSLLALLRVTLYPAGLRRRVYRSPLQTVLPRLSEQARRELLYTEDAFPGARDVETPYGSIRAYEWGPEDGPRVLLIHGITTSCITLGRIAHGLAKRGCRVMLFDLFGRGFSDGVGDLPHDARLYVSQALMVMASSPVSWTGSGKLRVVGYSMGAAIAVHLAAAFPDLVSSVVLVAPAGLIRASNFGITRHIFRSGLVPEGLLAALTRRRLRRPIAGGRVKKAGEVTEERGAGAEAAAGSGAGEAETEAETKAATETGTETETMSKISDSGRAKKRPDVLEAVVAEAGDPSPEDGGFLNKLEMRVRDYVHWMIEHHAGFVPAFMSCVRHAPLTEQEEAWRALSRRPRNSTAVVLARHDDVIDLAQYTEDALPLVGGEEHVHWRVLPGGHDVVMTHPDEILAVIDELWGGEA